MTTNRPAEHSYPYYEKKYWYKYHMHYLKPLLRALRTLNESELKLAFILGFLLFVAGLAELLGFGMA
jgi:hypothetical protein